MPHLVCTFYDKQINAKKYEWEIGSVHVLLVGNCIIPKLHNLLTHSSDSERHQLIWQFDMFF